MLPIKRSMAKLNPFDDLETLQDEMNRLFDTSISRWFDGDAGISDLRWAPALDVYNEKDQYVVETELPGLKKDEIRISVEGDLLTVEGERKFEHETKEKGVLRSERAYGTFARALTLPTEVDADKIKANYKDGVLKITLPKTEEAKPKQISVNVE